MSQGKVKDLVEKYDKGEVNSEEAYKELKKQGLLEKESLEFIPWVIYFILWLLPAIAQVPRLDFLDFVDGLQRFHFPAVVIYVALALSVLATPMALWVCFSHRKRGGLCKADETLVFYREGLYRVMRHPGVFGFMIWPVLLPFILSSIVPFTYFSIAAIAVMIIYTLYGVRMEEKLSVEKWGDTYLQYMREVPAFNLILGLWRLRKRK
jgi:protein-S-isoprenylcysteine O-methyltransferase Ste14